MKNSSFFDVFFFLISLLIQNSVRGMKEVQLFVQTVGDTVWFSSRIVLSSVLLNFGFSLAV